MHVLFDLGHPAHVHLFRNLALHLKELGHRVTITIRDRGIIGHLLRQYDLPYIVASKPRQGLLGLGAELAVHNWKVLQACLPERPDYLIGTSVSVAHVGRLIGRPSIVLNEDDADYVPLFARLTYPFATRVVIPSILRDRRTSKVRTHQSYHELAYLHRNHFTPDPNALQHLSVRPGESFSIVRLVSLTAHHDKGEKGLSIGQTERLIEVLSAYGKVFINSEGILPSSLQDYAFRAPPEHMHSILAFARVLVSDSQTMTMEAAVLGTPAIRCNSFVGRCSVISELEERFKLAWGYQPSDFDTMVEHIESILGDPELVDKMHERRERLLAEKVDLTHWLLDQLEQGFP